MGRSAARWLVVSLVLHSAAFAALVQSAEPIKCLGGLDPVALVAGERQPGKTDLFVDHGRYRYEFATAENRAAFVKEPFRFHVQYAGACARMGPLSGVGSPDRFLVHGGRIYLFASDACQATFEKSPDSFVERDDPRPETTPESLARGRELVELALRGLGGAEQVDAVKSLVLETRRPQGNTDLVTTWSVAFPDRFSKSQAWHGGGVTTAASGQQGADRDSKGTRQLEDEERQYLVREFRRIPLVLLKARGEKGFLAASAGRGRVGQIDAELLTVHFDGVSHTLALDPKSGRTLSIAYRGRLGGAIVPVVKSYHDFRDVEGSSTTVSLPFAVEAHEEGKDPAAKSAYSRVVVNGQLDDAQFELSTAK